MKVAILNMYASIAGMFGRLFGYDKKCSSIMTNTDPHKKKIRNIAPGRRQFAYLGVDGEVHTARVGSAFPVRPTYQARFFIATNENRRLLEIKS